MEWKVYIDDFNSMEIKEFNVFDHLSFVDDCRKAFKYSENKDDFAEQVKKNLRYYFKSKSEWEVILSSWPPSERIPSVKIDVYSQVMLNFEQFISYFWDELNNGV